MLEIPSNIYSHTKHLWDDIQAKLQTNTDDNTPFTMLPVRLETRFMKVRRKWSPFVQSDEMREVWDKVSGTSDDFDSVAGHSFSDASKEVDAYTEIAKSLSKAIEMVEADESLYPSGAKSAINESADYLKSSIESKINAANNNSELTAEQRVLLRANLDAINIQCDEFKAMVNSKAGGADEENNAADTEIESINDYQIRLNALNKKYSPEDEKGEVQKEEEVKKEEVAKEEEVVKKGEVKEEPKEVAIDESEVLNDTTQVLSDVKSISALLSEMNAISEEDKATIESMLSIFTKDVSTFLGYTGKISFNRENAARYASLSEEINGEKNKYTDLISRIPSGESFTFTEGDLLSLWNGPATDTEGASLPEFQHSQYITVNELWVRIFPDDIHIHTHENPLTAEEITAGLAYWNTWWNSGGDMEIRKGAWKALCELYGPERAAWIKEQMSPTNLPQEPVDDDTVGNWLDSLSHAGVDFAQKIIGSETYPDGVSANAETLRQIAYDLNAQVEAAQITRETQEKIIEVTSEFEKEAEAFSQMVTLANESEMNIDEAALASVDYEELFADLAQSITSLRDPESEFNFPEWASALSESEGQFTDLGNQIRENRVDFLSLLGAKSIVSNFSSELNENEAILNALPESNPEDPNYELILGRVEGNEEEMRDAIAGVKNSLKTFGAHADTSIKNIKYSKINLDVEAAPAFLALIAIYGQIKQTVNNAAIVAPWNIFDHLPPGEAPVFPTPDVKDGPWTQAPKTFVMPDRFVAVGLDESVVKDANDTNYGENTYTFKQLEVGELVPAELHVGIDPTIEDDNIYAHTQDGNLIVDDAMKWMVDFNTSVNNGMGIIMKLENDFTPGQADNVFDKLVVMGVKVEKDRFHQPDANKDYTGVDLKEYSKELLEELLINHHYKEEGMGIVSVGSATNNTENNDSNWKFDQLHFEDSFAVENLNNLFPIRTSHLEQRNGQRLAEALGVDYSIFQHIENAGSNDISDGFKMNKMLWHGTVGNYLQEMLSGLVSRSNYEKTKNYFESNVSARGVIPTLRVGNQPYGILPTTSHTKWEFDTTFGPGDRKHPTQLDWNRLFPTSGNPADIKNYYTVNRFANNSLADKRFDDGFKKLLDLLQNRWYGLFHEPDLVKHVGGVSGTSDFMQALGLHASTAEIQLRFPYSIADLFSDRKWILPSSNPFYYYKFTDPVKNGFYGLEDLGTEWINLVKSGLFYEKSIAFSQDNIVNHIEFLNAYFKLYKNPIDQHKLSENQLISRTQDNYIEWIRTADLRDIWDPVAAASNPFGTDAQPLLFKLLRQSYLMMHLDAFVDTSVQSGLIDPNTYHLLSNGAKTISNLVGTSGGNVGNLTDRFSKWTYLLENISDFSGSTGAYQPLDFYKTAFDSYVTSRNITGLDTTNITFAEHVQNYYSKFWRLRGGYQNKRSIAEMDLIYRDVKTWPTAHIDRLFRENLDLGSYRLDAWMDGFVNRRLKDIRTSTSNNVSNYVQAGVRQREKGVYIGAYGWLENVKPGGERTAVSNSDPSLPEELKLTNTTIFTDDDNLGFIHGPSMYHAMTAAILRSGYASNEDVATNLANPMAVNLSSERVRMAKNLWEGIRNGQSLGALLGYQLERNLHELYTASPGWELDQYIYQLRKKYPIEVYKNSIGATGAESVPAQNVVNGIDLLGDIREEMNSSTSSLYDYVNTHLGGSKNFSITVTDPAVKAAIAREIDLLANAIDALGDLSIAEGVFQLTKGNFDRASSTIDTLLDNRNLPLPEFLDTPRTGAVLSNKFCVNLESGIDPFDVVINPWTSVALTDKANLAPHLNQFIAKYLPAPSNIKCIVQYVDVGEIAVQQIVSVEDLGWQPIDFYVNLMAAVNHNESDQLLERVANYARTQYTYNSVTPIPFENELTILLNQRDFSWGTTEYSFFELLPVLESLSKVMSEIKPTKIQDFKLPELTSLDDAYGWDLADLNARITAAQSDLNTLITSSSTDYKLLLTTAESYKVRGASPKSDDVLELTDQWLAVKDQLQVLYDGVEDIVNNSVNGPLLSYTGINDEDKWKQFLKAAQLMFGADFVLLPMLDLTTDGADVFLDDYVATKQTDLMSEVGTSGFDQDVLGQWFYGLSRMKAKLGAFESLSDFDDTNELEFGPLQFPYVNDIVAGTHDYWYGWEFPDSYESTGNKTAVIMADKTTFNAALINKKMVGFILDEWTETIPEKKETTGVAFHYDQPNSKPPQNILVAVTPSFTGNWDANDILFTVLDTLKMAKIRLVEPEHLQTDKMLGKYLPSTYSMIELSGGNILNGYDMVSDYMDGTAAS